VKFEIINSEQQIRRELANFKNGDYFENQQLCFPLQQVSRVYAPQNLLVTLGYSHEMCVIYGVGYPVCSIASFCASFSGSSGVGVIEGISSINKNEAVVHEV
jgi:hypothetical protein